MRELTKSNSLTRGALEEVLIVMACDGMALHPSEFFARRRTRLHSFTRFAVMDVLHRSGAWTALEAAKAVGRSEHSITLYAKKKAGQRREQDAMYDDLLTRMERFVSTAMDKVIADPVKPREPYWKSRDERSEAISVALRLNPEYRGALAKAKKVATEMFGPTGGRGPSPSEIWSTRIPNPRKVNGPPVLQNDQGVAAPPTKPAANQTNEKR